MTGQTVKAVSVQAAAEVYEEQLQGLLVKFWHLVPEFSESPPPRPES